MSKIQQLPGLPKGKTLLHSQILTMCADYDYSSNWVEPTKEELAHWMLLRDIRWGNTMQQEKPGTQFAAVFMQQDY